MMFFNHPKVRQFLLQRKEVYTLREKKRHEGRDSLVVGRLFKTKKIGFGQISMVKKITKISPKKLKPYVKKSGLKNSKEWIDALKTFCKGKVPRTMYLYNVQLETKNFIGER